MKSVKVPPMSTPTTLIPAAILLRRPVTGSDPVTMSQQGRTPLGGGRVREAALDEDSDELRLVVGRAVCVVYRLGGLGRQRCGFRDRCRVPRRLCPEPALGPRLPHPPPCHPADR